MKRILLYSTLFLTINTLFFTPKASGQMVNSLYFLERTPFHTQWNPAMAPKRSGLGVGISNISLSVQSDLALNDLIFPGKNGGKPYTFLSPEADANAFLNGLNDVSSIRFRSNVDLLNLGIRFLNNYVTFHSSISTDAGMGLPKDLFRMVMVGMDNNASTKFDLTGTNLNAMIYSKIGAGYSMNIGKIFSAGINLNYLQGLADMRMGFDKLTVDAGSDKWDVTTKGYIQMAAPDFVGFQYDEDGYFNGLDTDSDVAGSLGTSGRAGSGYSIDLGVTAKPLPFLTLSAAILDLGSIKWDANCVQRAKSNGTYTFDGVALNEAGKENSSSSETMDDLEEMVHFEKDNSFGSYNTRLTTKINLGAEAGLLNNKISIGVLSQTGITEDGKYQDVMVSANLKPSSIIQGALTYSLLHGERSSFGAAVNCKLLFLNIFAAADYLPFKYTPQMVPINNSYYNMQFGVNMMF